MDQRTQQFAELMKRPDIDQASARYEQMYGETRQRLVAEFPTLQWRQSLEQTSASCGNDFAAVNAGLRTHDAIVRGMGNWVGTGGFRDDQWERALATVGEVAHQYGFDAHPKVIANQPGNHESIFRDEYNAELTFGVGKNVGLTFESGCHLTAEAKKRGTPAQGPSY
ncbi:putative LppA-like lipoprotein [Amycolatopsis sulphurea]|uniref:Putative LppA-like lipoprotein n=2 Tax=Amycolatopsis sulphurea TaxID=76022 RepID=A0A2A9FAD2_9PSEU|nr:putative LppA-like lipoprotein [Amycolatopsis sulphurea]